jgi:TetR/AcrR family transcriptional repressor of nem operon
MRLFAQKGYQSSTISEIAGEADANAGSVYFFFPTKQQLLLAVLDRYHDGIEEMLLRPAWAGITDPVDRVFALLDRYRTFLVDTACSYGCPIGNLALELNEPDPAVRQRLAANFDAWRDAIERCLGEVRDRLPADVSPRDLATFVLTTMEGGVMQARTYRGPEPFDASVRMLKDYFTRLLQPHPAGRTS